jgi:hypothetical protein
LVPGGTGAGTGSPEILNTALKRSGQTSKQTPHLVHFSWSIQWTIPLSPTTADAGQLRKQIRQAVHFSGSM